MSTTPFVKFKQDLGDNKFALNTVGYGMTESGIWVPIKVTDEGVQEVRQSGTIVELLYSHAGSANVIISPGSVITLLPADERLGFKEYRAIFYFERSVDHEVLVEHMVTPITQGPAESFQFDTNKSKVRVDTYSDMTRIRVRNKSTTDVKCNYARILGVK